MTQKLAFNELPQFADGNGDPYAGGLLFTYLAGSSTKQTTYQNEAGSTPNTNPIELDADGRTPYPVWLTTGLTYKFVLAPADDTDPPQSPIWTLDNITGINDTSLTIDQWVAGPAPTYVSATSFTLVGDQTSAFQVGRRLKTTNSGGTVYSTITASAFTTVTTVTVINDSGTLDAGLSAVSYGLISATNKSLPPFDLAIYVSSVAGTNTITGSAANTPAPLVAGQLFSFIPAVTNTGATTLNINGLGAKNVFYRGAACAGGEIVASAPALVSYDGTQFNLVGSSGAYTSFTGTLTGCTTAPTYTITYSKIGSTVTIDVPVTTGTSNAVTKTITGMPAAIRPTTQKATVGRTVDNSASAVPAIITVETSGVITYGATIAAQGNFTNSGTFSGGAFCLTYTLA